MSEFTHAKSMLLSGLKIQKHSAKREGSMDGYNRRKIRELIEEAQRSVMESG